MPIQLKTYSSWDRFLTHIVCSLEKRIRIICKWVAGWLKWSQLPPKQTVWVRCLARKLFSLYRYVVNNLNKNLFLMCFTYSIRWGFWRIVELYESSALVFCCMLRKYTDFLTFYKDYFGHVEFQSIPLHDM